MDAAVSVDGPEDGSPLDPGGRQPIVEGSYRTVPRSAVRNPDFSPSSLLIGLGPCDRYYQTLADVLDVTAIEPDQF
jgi:hypothetical protein